MTKKIVIIIMFLVSLYSVNASLNDANLVESWTFDTNANGETGNFNADDNTATHINTGGIIGGAYRYSGDGNDYINYSKDVISTTAFAVSYWIYQETSPENYTHGYHMSDANDVTNFLTRTLNDSGTIKWDGYIDGIEYKSALPLGSWYHIVVNHSNTGNVTIYVNGTLFGTITSSSFTGLTTTFYLGNNGANTRPFEGIIDELTIWNRTVTMNEVTSLYNSGTGLQYPFQSDYYFSQTGSDSNPCTQASPCKTITKLNTISLSAGDTVYFNRGDIWHSPNDAFISLDSGTAGNYITYSAYGTGALPIITGSINSTSTGNWTNIAGNRWRYNKNYTTYEIGNLIFNTSGTVTTATRNYSLSAMDAEGQGSFYQNYTGDDTLWIYSVGNPVTYYGDIEIAVEEEIINTDNDHDIIIENLDLRYSARHAIGGATNYNLWIRNNSISYIGGGCTTCPTRLGNAIEFWEGAYNHMVEYNNISQVLDAAFTNQGDAGVWQAYNITYQRNIAWNVAYCYETFTNGYDSSTENVSFIFNTCYNMGEGWYYPQRTNYDRARGVRIGRDRSHVKNVNITNNIFYKSLEQLIENHPPCDDCDNTQTNYTHNYNFYWRDLTSGLNNYFAVWKETDYYTSLSAWQTGETQDLNSTFNQNIGFISETENTQSFLQPLASSPVCDAASDGTDIGALPCAEGGTNVSNQMYQTLSAETFSDNMGTGSYNHSTRWSVINDGDWEVAQVDTGAGYSNYMLIGNDTVTIMRGTDPRFNPLFNTVELISQIMPITEQTDFSNPHCTIGFDNAYNQIGWINSSGNITTRNSTGFTHHPISWTKNTSKWVRVVYNHTTQNNTYFYKNSTTDSWSYIMTESAYTTEYMRAFVRANDAKCAFDNVILRRIGNEQNADIFSPSFIYHSLNDTIWKSATIQYHDSVGSVYNDTFNNPTHATDMSRTLYPSTWTLNVTLCDNNNICTNTTTKPVTTYNSKIVNITDVAGNPISSFCTFNGTSYTGSDLNLSMIDVTDLTLSCSAQPGFEAFTTEIVLNSSNQAVTRNSAMLFITFSETVYVVISDASTVAYYQNTTTINMTQTNLSIGKVRIDYGTTENHGQVYEYYNDWNTNINETLQVLDNMDTNFYAAAETASGYRLDDAYIYVYQYNKTSDLNSMNMVQTGQYMTDNKKPTLINLDSDKLYWIQVEKSGYSAPPLKNIHPDNITGSLDAPFVFELTKSSLDITSPWATWVTPYPLINTSPGQDITLHTQLPTYATIATSNRFYITTNYRESDGAINGLALTTINSDTRYWKEMTNIEYCDAWGLLCADTRRFTITLVEGTDFNWNDTQINITMLAYYNLYYRYDSTIVPLVRTDVGIITIETDTGWSSTVVAVVIFVLVILGAAFIKYFTQSQDMAFHTYMIGLIAVAAIAQAFYIVAGITVLYYGLRWVSQASGGGGDA